MAFHPRMPSHSLCGKLTKPVHQEAFTPFTSNTYGPKWCIGLMSIFYTQVNFTHCDYPHQGHVGTQCRS